MFRKCFGAVVLFISVAGSDHISVSGTVDDYRFLSEIDGYLKLHRYPAKWQDARLRCHLEGGMLASPTDENTLAAMKQIIKKDNLVTAGPSIVYTGIHATYSDGDFTTLTGIPLSYIDVQWAHNEPDGGQQNCLIMFQSGQLGDVDCDNDYPYICFKSKEQIDAHKCGPEFNSSDYKLDYRTGSCYKFHTEGRPWSKAFMTCTAEDAHLAIINSKLESDVLKELFNKYPHSAIPGDLHKDSTSIGFTKWKEIGEWYTIHEQSLAEAGFSTFNPGEPNNADQKEWCGSIMRSGLLNDHDCNRLQTFICEKYSSEDNEHFQYNKTSNRVTYV